MTCGHILAVLLAVTSGFFAPSLLGGFVYDDFRDVVLNPSAQAETFFTRLSLTVRPLLKATYALQDAIHGANPKGYHAVNLALHLACTAMVFTLFNRILEKPVAALATLLWALHPLTTETVTYVSGRSTGLSSVLILAALLAATADRPRPWLAFLCAFLAPLARETALITPVLLAVWQVTVGAGKSNHIGRIAPVWLGAILAGSLLAALPTHRDLVAFSLDQRGPLDALRANLFAVPEMLRFWVLPWSISAVPVQPVTYGWIESPTLMRIAALLSAGGFALYWRRTAPVFAFAVLWVVVALAPTNSLIWRVDPVAIRPLYLASIGLALVVAAALCRFRHGLALGLILALWLGTLTWERTWLYAGEANLFADAATKAPQDVKAQLLHGLALANAGRHAEALSVIEAAQRLDPSDPAVANALRLLETGVPIYRTPVP